jgi:small-conductance mechanosensitive channel
MSFDFLDREILQNKISDYLIAISVLGLGTISIKSIRNSLWHHLERWSKRTTTPLDDYLLRLGEKAVIPLLYLGVFYLGISNLTLHPILDRVFDAIAIIIASILGIRFFIALAEHSLRFYWVTYTNNPNLEQTLISLIPAIRAIVWTLGIIFLLDNLGFNISAVVTGLGIGGVAVALASKGVLEDLFSYFAILFDRPFEIGHSIGIGDLVGTVKTIGIKTTRLQSVTGEELAIANKDLTNSRLKNFTRMSARRVLFQIGVTYETPVEKLQDIPQTIQTIIESQDLTTFDRAHFSSYGESKLFFEVVYYINTSDYKHYMDVQQHVNFELKRQFEQQQIEFAYPKLETNLNLSTERGNVPENEEKSEWESKRPSPKPAATTEPSKLDSPSIDPPPSNL